MPNRRTFIQSGLAFSTFSIPGLSGIKAAVGTPAEPFQSIENFIVDTRYSASLVAAEELKQQGIPIIEINGDITDLWYKQYSTRWKQQTMTLAGVTGQDALFVLETLAPDYRMQVVHKELMDSASAQTDSSEVTLYSWIIAPKMT